MPQAPSPLTTWNSETLEAALERARLRGRRSLRSRLKRIKRRGWFIGQASVAAGVAWWVAADLFHHYAPVFAPMMAVVCLGMSYTQRLRRVTEVTVGVAVGLFVATVFVSQVGSGGWQIMVVVALGMISALLLDAGPLMVSQAAVQGIFVAAFAPGEQAGFTRWQDAVIGGVVALLAAAIVPSAPLRRPRIEASMVAKAVADVLRNAASAARDGDIEGAVGTLAQARNTQQLVRELQEAAEEGMAVIASSPFVRKSSDDVRRVADLIEPLDRALINTRVLARRTLAACVEGVSMPESYPRAFEITADAAEVMSHVLAENGLPAVARPALSRAARNTAQVERTPELSLEVILGQLQSVIVDLLQASGLSLEEAIATIPRPAPSVGTVPDE